MKIILFVLVVIAFCACGSSEKKAGGTNDGASLEHRLDQFMELTDKMDLEELMEYTYPKLFTIAPKESVLKALKEAYNSEEVRMQLDSLKIEKIYPVFEMENGSYAKIDYSMVMLMDFKDHKY